MIDWSLRIHSKTIDISGLPYYKLTYGNNKNTMIIDEHEVELPDEAPDEECVNFGLPLNEQIYRNTYIPKQVLNPSKDYGRENWSDKQKKGFVDHMWNIRKNGFWMFIKGRKTYIHPLLWFKLNHTDTRGKFIYKHSDLEFFMFWNHCLRRPNCNGMIDFKCRQLGDTQNTLVIIYEFGSRMRGSLNTMQSAINEKNIDRAFDRLTEIHKNMIYYFKPIHQGSEDAKSGKLVFKYPIELNTHKRIRDRVSKGESLVSTSSEEYEYPELNSQFHVGVTRENEFDGATDLGRVYLDEFGKCFKFYDQCLMYDGTYKNIGEIRVGDVVMGDDSTPRNVISTTNGSGKMYSITPKANGWASYTVNGKHTLVMKWGKTQEYCKWKRNEIVEMSVEEFMCQTENVKRHMTLYRVQVDYPAKEIQLDPYILGVWIGDGSHTEPNLTNPDTEIIEYVKDFCAKNELKLSSYTGLDHRICGIKAGHNGFLKTLKDLNLLSNKHIPKSYLFNSREIRLQLLAGLLDTDGYLNKAKNAYEITQKRQDVGIAIHRLAQELGFKSNLDIKIGGYTRADGTKFKGEYYRVAIFGQDLYQIPCKVERKKVYKKPVIHKNSRDSKKTCFKVEQVENGDFYGFETDGNNRFLLKDCQVVHNCKSGFSASEWLRVMLEAIFSKITGKKTGMIIMTSTVDEITPETLEESINLYKEASPKKLLKNGSTINGLLRIFRGVVARGEVDHWGDPLAEKILRETTEQYNAMIESGNLKGALSYIQKNPRTIDDVFVSVNNQSQFHTENLVRRQMQLDTIHPKPYVRGNFKWKDGVRDTEVIWEPNQQGRWEVSKHPHDYGLENNVKRINIISKKPANSYYFSAGVDPIDQKHTIGVGSEISKAAFCIGRRFDQSIDGGESKYYQYEDEIKGIQKGDPIDLGSFHQTNRTICTYINRPEDPADFFEDLLMTLVYYGSDYLPEKNKAGALLTYMDMRGYSGYLMEKPTSISNVKGKVEKDAVTMSEKTGNMMFDYITTYTCKMANAIDHPELLAQLLSMNWGNRGKKDLGVAFGWMLYAFNNKKQKRPIDKEEEVTGVEHWEENVV